MDFAFKSRFFTLSIISCSFGAVSYAYPISSWGVESLPIIIVSADETGLEESNRSTLTRENINRQQADNAAALVDVLPGVNLVGTPRPNGQNLNIWGMGDSEDVRILLDGNQKNFERYRQGSIFIEPELLKRVDMDKGNFSAKYGNGGFGGTVHFETKNPADFLHNGEHIGGFVKYGYHSNDKQNNYTGALFAQTADQKGDMLLYGTLRNGQDLTRPDGSSFKYSENKNKSYLLKTHYSFNTYHHLGLSAMYSQSHSWQPFAAMADFTPQPSISEIQRYGLDLAWKRKLVYRNQRDENYALDYFYTPDNPFINVAVKLGVSRTKQEDTRPESASNYFSGSMGNYSHTQYNDSHFEISNTATFDTGAVNHQLNVGLQWHRSQRKVMMLDRSKLKNADYNFGWYTPYYMPSGQQYQHSVYLEDKVRYGNWVFIPALRYDDIRNAGQENVARIYNNRNVGHDYRSRHYRGWSPFFAIQWNPTPYLNFFANINRTWRAPVIDEQYEVQYAKASITGSSRDLQKEKITQVQLGTMLNLEEIFLPQDKLQFRTTLFRSRGKQEIFKTRGVYDANAHPISNYRNLPGYTIQGAELEAYYDSNYLFGSLTYSYMKGQRDASPRDPDFPSKTWIAEIPPRRATITLGSHIPKWDLSLGWRADMVRRQDRSPIDNDPQAGYWSLPKTAGYTLHNAFLSWKPRQFKDFHLYLSVDNIFNKHYQVYLGEKSSGLGRNIKLSLSKQF